MSNWIQYFIIILGVVSGIITIISGIMNIVEYLTNRVLSKLTLFVSSLIVTIIFFIIIASTNILSSASSADTTEQTTSNTNDDYIDSGSNSEPATKVEEIIVYPDIDMDYIRDSDVTSSGYLVAENYGISSSYYPFFVIDGDLHNAWLDSDTNGFGYNEWVQIKFDQTYVVNGIRIYSGYHKNEEILHRNNRIKDIEIVFSDGTSFKQTLEDKPVGEYNIIELDESIATESIRFIIKSVYPADYPYAVCWDDTGISEIILY